MRKFRWFFYVAVGIFSILWVAGCAHVPDDPDDRAEYERNHDPAEPLNRKIFAGNMMADHYVLQPVARAYKDDLPSSVQQGVHNFAGNLLEPQIAVNDVLQGHVACSGNTVLRFAVNSTIGVAGMFDVATAWNLPHHDADFGQTFGVWGIGSGPFVELPLLGASNVRDSVGTVVGIVTNPFGSVIAKGPLTTIGYVGSGFGLVDGRAQVLDITDSLEKNSIDYYSTLRSIAWQRRAKLIADGKAPDLPNNAPTKPDPSSQSPMVPLLRSAPYL